jgi:hypothetical protein
VSHDCDRFQIALPPRARRKEGKTGAGDKTRDTPECVRHVGKAGR